MQFSESWLREYCNPPLSSEALAEVLTMGGLEVEERRPAAPPFTGVVVGRILSAEPHPQADRLRVCRVDAGQGGEPLQIVCGAPNARAGITVPCALVGASLPATSADGEPLRIGISTLRGVESQGMLCSARELGLAGEPGAGLLELDVGAAPGADVRKVLDLDDTLLTLKLTPNLAHALSVQGVARELAALTGAPLRIPAISAVPARHAEVLPVDVEARDLCGRFAGRIVRGVNARAATPPWMVERLARCGQRSVSALVDISNYVMFETGQPTHIFDLARIHGSLAVRWARAGEALPLLNGVTVALDGTVGVVADDAAVESLAGIMGGAASAVSDATNDIYMEAAFWWPQAVQGRSRRFNFSTDAGHRFERGVDFSRTALVLERVTELVLAICGGSPGPVDDQVLEVPARQPVTLRVARAGRVIGMPLTQAECATPLRRLGFEVVEGDGVLVVTPPAYRFDLVLEEDLIEEVVRLIGYEHLPASPPLAPIRAAARPESRRSPLALRHRLADLGYQETINFSFVEASWERDLAGNAQPIKLLNPIASPLSVMRSSLIGSLLQVLKFNVDRKMGQVRIFEAGRVFLRDPGAAASDDSVAGVRQPMRVAGLAWGDPRALRWEGKARRADFFDVKGDVEALLAPAVASFERVDHPALHPGRAARVLLDGKEVGVLGELHPRWCQQWEFPQPPVLFELDADALMQRVVPHAAPVPKQQDVTRDLAVVVNEAVTHEQLQRAALSVAGAQAVLRRVVLFDIFRAMAAGDPDAATGREKSVALRLVLNGGDAPLSEQSIDATVQAVLAALAASVGARLRA